MMLPPRHPSRRHAASRPTPVLLGLALSAALGACTGGGDAQSRPTDTALAAATAAAAALPAAEPAHVAHAAAATHAVADSTLVATVYKTPTCGCCRAWVEHLRANGFRVETVDQEDLTPIKAAHGVGEHLASCHTALIGGYVVEGHVPAADVVRLLKERPAVAGIAAPGMPTGSPGMEMPGAPAERYDVVSFDRAGQTKVFAQH